MGGAVAAIDGYMKGQLVESNTARLAAIETGEQVLVGVNGYTETEPSPLSAGDERDHDRRRRGRGRADRASQGLARGRDAGPCARH